MTPTVGETVLFRGLESNGAFVHPALITRVWGQSAINGQQYTTVNLHIFPDANPPVARTSIMLFRSEREAELAEQKYFAYFTPELA